MTPFKPLNINGALEFGEIDHSDHDQAELTRELLQRDGTLLLLLEKDRAMVDAAGRLALIPVQEAEKVLGSANLQAKLLLYLGRVFEAEGVPDDGISVAGTPKTAFAAEKVPILAVTLTQDEVEGFTQGSWLSLRRIATDLNALDAGLLTRAVALSNWHGSHGFSPKTGHRTVESKGGWVRVDEHDGSEHFPRTDPAVIVGIVDSADRLLLASNLAWNEKVFSLIAGFVDPGESLEQAVVREVYEETGLKVENPQYLGSQPWPFPASLMLGFTAQFLGEGNLKPDGVEIRALRWFSRLELREAVAAGQIIIPGKSSISRAIIEAWYGEELTVQAS